MRAAVTSTEYNWYGQRVKIDLQTCHEALVRTVLNYDLTDLPPTQAFARKVKLHPETVLRFLRGDKVGATSVSLILAGLGLRSEEVLERAV